MPVVDKDDPSLSPVQMGYCEHAVVNRETVIKERYELYRKHIAERLFAGRDPGAITGIQGMHYVSRHGGMTSRLDTASGGSLFYKPHDCRSSELLGDITELLFGRRLVPAQLSGDGFAFQENVTMRIPKTDEEKDSFYLWMGRLTAVFYALGSIDMHARNIFSCGGLPLVVDTETLFCPKPIARSEAWEFSLDYRDIFPDFRSSVEECRVLPLLSGIMQASPLMPGWRCTTEGYEDRFLSGFEEGYRRACENRAGVTKILDRYTTVPFRYLFRPNMVYLSAQEAYRDAESQEDKIGVLQKLEKDLSEKGRACWKSILAWERASIIEGNLPVFTVLAGDRDLRAEQVEDVLVPGFFERSPIEEAKRRMGRMGDEDLAVQAAYIRASLKHVDGWTFDREEERSLDELAPLSLEVALEEVHEAIDCLWEERIPLSEGRMLWHVPLATSEGGSLLRFAEAFSGTAVFAHACAESPLFTGESRAKAEEMASAAFRSMATFGTYFLNKYPDPPAEHLLSRRLKGGFVFKDVLAGLLWAIRQCKAEDPETADRILRGFESWNLKSVDEDARAFLKRRYENAQTDILADTDILGGGNAGLAAALLLEAEADCGNAESLERAGRTLNRMVERKKETGCYRVFRSGRKQYFFPGFSRGSTGIAAVTFRYAELLRGVAPNTAGSR